MNRKAFLLLLGSGMIIFALSMDVGQGRAEPQMTVQSQAPSVPFRDPNNRMKMHRVTNAQKRAAAKRAAARRAAAGRTAGISTSAPNTSPPQDTEGGTK